MKSTSHSGNDKCFMRKLGEAFEYSLLGLEFAIKDSCSSTVIEDKEHLRLPVPSALLISNV